MNRDTATACWYRRLDPACFTDQSSASLYAEVGSLSAPAAIDRANLWASPPTTALTGDDASPIAETSPVQSIFEAIAGWIEALIISGRPPLSGQRQPR